MSIYGHGVSGNIEVESSLQYKYLVNLLMSSDTEVYLHSTHVRNILCAFLTRLVSLGIVSDDTADLIVSSALIHDLGKLIVPNQILHSESKLSNLDFGMIKCHSEAGEIVIRAMLYGTTSERFIKLASNVARNHHERLDGDGYPDRLSGKNIPLEARISAIADVYEALRSIRSYKMAYSHEEALKIMVESAGKHLDSELLNIFMTIDCYKYGF